MGLAKYLAMHYQYYFFLSNQVKTLVYQGWILKIQKEEAETPRPIPSPNENFTF